ncbi:MAG: dihydroorotate dehydrogenase [Chloroflexi bacterium]|nr:dihydroorotate dehydrogenase [Chloroflexota bacterium]
MSPSLAVDLAGLRLANPLVLASGIWGCAAETLVRAARAGAGAVTSKSCSVAPRTGHPNPTVLPWAGGLINAVGLANPGAAEERLILQEAHKSLIPLGVSLIASIFGSTPDDYAEAAELVAGAQPEILEVNISCPNVASEFGLPFALEPDAAAAVTRAVRAAYAGRVFIKLSPNAVNIVEVAAAAAEAGADGFTAVNTLGPGMLIDITARRPILSNRVGGVSGAALRPIALRCIHDVTRAIGLPVIGTGGVDSGEAAIQMIMAGASAVGVGSALLGEGDAVFSRLQREMLTIMQHEGIASLEEIRGCAHAG